MEAFGSSEHYELPPNSFNVVQNSDRERLSMISNTFFIQWRFLLSLPRVDSSTHLST